MARKEDLRFVRTNRKLYEAFCDLITESVIEDLSVTDICDAAKINRATFYKHFNDRKEFVFYFVAQKLREMRLENTGREHANAATIYEDAVREIYAFLRYMTAVNADNLSSDRQGVHILYDAMMRFYMHEFSAYYTKTKKNEGVNANLLAAYRVGSLLSIAFYSLMQGEEHISEQACEEIINIFVAKINESEK